MNIDDQAGCLFNRMYIHKNECRVLSVWGLVDWADVLYIHYPCCFGKQYLLKLKQLNRKRPASIIVFLLAHFYLSPPLHVSSQSTLIKFDLNEHSSTINPNGNRNKFIFTFMSAKIYTNFRFGFELMAILLVHLDFVCIFMRCLFKIHLHVISFVIRRNAFGEKIEVRT